MIPHNTFGPEKDLIYGLSALCIKLKNDLILINSENFIKVLVYVDKESLILLKTEACASSHPSACLTATVLEHISPPPHPAIVCTLVLQVHLLIHQVICFTGCGCETRVVCASCLAEVVRVELYVRMLL